MNENSFEFVRIQIIDTVKRLRDESSPWVSLADLGNTLRGNGINYHEYGFVKLRPFLESVEELEFKVVDYEDKPPVYFVRLNTDCDKYDKNSNVTVPKKINKTESKKLTPDLQLTKWAYISWKKYDSLVKMMPAEDWGRIEKDESNDETKESTYIRYPKLEHYIAYTAKRLAHEKKILYAVNPSENIEYAAFNTGLVDKSYNWIYALFKENTLYPNDESWFLIDFVIAGQNAGKTLNSIFADLPQRANYFESLNDILYDSSKRLSCDYEHFLIEHPERLPPEFIRMCCPELATIDNISVEEAYSKDFRDENRRNFYEKFSRLLMESPSSYNNMREKLEKSVEMSIKRVEWNHRTAVPMYYPTTNRGALLLPLALVTIDKVDVALVVTQEHSGAYQGQTILTLEMAYDNSRLIEKPYSDWLASSPNTK